MMKRFRLASLAIILLTGNPAYVYGEDSARTSSADADSPITSGPLEFGQRLYREGILPSGGTIKARVKGDIEISGEQVICGSCHRRSALGSSEGQEVVPPITGDILFAPLRLPVSKPPLPPLLRPAYTDASIKRAIREGIDANGGEMGSFMPRYPMTDQQMDILLDYLKSLNTDPAPGVTAKDIHFATIIDDSVTPATRKAMLDVMHTFIEQKNVETRYESKRAEKTPWHKDWLFKPYRKWALHVWELTGSRDEWRSQLENYYREQPVFAVLGGIASGHWEPVHNFCEQQRIPCLFPITSLPVSDKQDFYTLYLNKGMMLEGEAVVQHLADDKLLNQPVVQVYRESDALGQAAAAALRRALQSRGGSVTDILLHQGGWDVLSKVLEAGNEATVVLWLPKTDVESSWGQVQNSPTRIYLSTTLYAKPNSVPANQRAGVYFIHPSELPAKLPRLLARSTGWLRVKRVYSGNDREVQADAFFTLKMAAGALKGIGAYFNRDYFLERIEHMVDNATYTSIYPRISLAPNQRFVSKGVYITQISKDSAVGLVAVTDWLIPGSR